MPQEFKGQYEGWTAKAKAISSYESTNNEYFLAWFLTVDSETVKLAPRFNTRRLVVANLAIALVAVFFAVEGGALGFGLLVEVVLLLVFLGILGGLQHGIGGGLEKAGPFPLSHLANVQLNGRRVKFTVFASPVKPETSPGDPSPSDPAGAPDTWESGPPIDCQIMFQPASEQEAATLRDLLPKIRVQARDLSVEPAAETVTKQAITGEKDAFDQRLKALSPRIWATWLLVALNLLALIAMVQGFGASSGFWKFNYGPENPSLQWWRLPAGCFFWGDDTEPVLAAVLVLGMCFGRSFTYLKGLGERLFGGEFYLVIYLSCGLVGMLVSLLCKPFEAGGGALPAVFGICGSVAGYWLRHPNSTAFAWKPRPAFWIAFFYVTINCLSGAHPSDLIHFPIAWLGGLFAGVLFGFVAARPLEVATRGPVAVRTALRLTGCVVVVLGGLALWVYVLEPEREAKAAQARVAMQLAEAGDKTAQKRLGLMLAHGQGLPMDKMEACKWLLLGGGSEHDAGFFLFSLDADRRMEVNRRMKEFNDQKPPPKSP